MVLNTSLIALADESTQTQDLSVPRQPMLAQVHRLTEAMEVVGNPFDAETQTQLMSLKSESDDAKVISEVQRLLDPF